MSFNLAVPEKTIIQKVEQFSLNLAPQGRNQLIISYFPPNAQLENETGEFCAMGMVLKGTLDICVNDKFKQLTAFENAYSVFSQSHIKLSNTSNEPLIILEIKKKADNLMPSNCSSYFLTPDKYEMKRTKMAIRFFTSDWLQLALAHPNNQQTFSPSHSNSRITIDKQGEPLVEVETDENHFDKGKLFLPHQSHINTLSAAEKPKRVSVNF